MVVQIPSGLSNAPPTARLVYLALDDAPALTIAELTERTGSCTRAVKEALGTLRSQGFVERSDHPTDGRMAVYTTASTPAIKRGTDT